MASKFSKMWHIIEIPVYILVLWSIISIVMLSQGWGNQILNSIINWVLMIGCFGYIGYATIKKGEGIGSAAKGGAFAGAILGIVGAIMGIIAFSYMPSIYEKAIEDAVAKGTPRDTIETFMKIGIYVSIVIAPIINSLIGAGIAALSGLIFRKKD